MLRALLLLALATMGLLSVGLHLVLAQTEAAAWAATATILACYLMSQAQPDISNVLLRIEKKLKEASDHCVTPGVGTEPMLKCMEELYVLTREALIVAHRDAGKL